MTGSLPVSSSEGLSDHRNDTRRSTWPICCIASHRHAICSSLNRTDDDCCCCCWWWCWWSWRWCSWRVDAGSSGGCWASSQDEKELPCGSAVSILTDTSEMIARYFSSKKNDYFLVIGLKVTTSVTARHHSYPLFAYHLIVCPVFFLNLTPINFKLSLWCPLPKWCHPGRSAPFPLPFLVTPLYIGHV